LNPQTDTVLKGNAHSLITNGFVITNNLYVGGSETKISIIKVQGSEITTYQHSKGQLLYSLNPNYIIIKFKDAYEVLDLNMNRLFLVYK